MADMKRLLSSSLQKSKNLHVRDIRLGDGALGEGFRSLLLAPKVVPVTPLSAVRLGSLVVPSAKRGTSSLNVRHDGAATVPYRCGLEVH